jgi:hypothetical protein
MTMLKANLIQIKIINKAKSCIRTECENSNLRYIIYLIILLTLAIAFASCSDRLEFGKEYIIEKADQKLAISVTTPTYTRQAYLHIHNIDTVRVHCQIEIMVSLISDGTGLNINIFLGNFYDKNNDFNADTDAKQLRRKELVIIDKTGIVKLKRDEQMQIYLFPIEKENEEYNLHLKWY